MKYKLLDKLQFYFQKDRILVELNEKFLSEKQHIFDIEDFKKHFAEVEEMGIKNNKLSIYYLRPNNYEPLFKFRDYADYYKLDIVNQLLEMGVVENTRTFLSMTNILVKDTRNLLLIYKADEYDNLPYDQREPLEQYKNFICSFFGKNSLEKYQKNRETTLEKEKNTFLTEVNQIESIEHLTTFIHLKLTEEQRNFFQEQINEKKKEINAKRLSKTAKIASVSFLILAFAGTVLFMKQAESKKINAIEKENAIEVKFLTKIIEGDSKDIEEEMKQLDYPKEKQMEVYVKLGEFKQAYDLDKKADKKIVSLLYKQGKTNEIKKLELPGSDYLETMKKILAYKDQSAIDYIVQSENDPLLIKAVIDEAIEQEDISTLETIRQIVIEQKNLEVSAEDQGKIIDTLIESNTKQLEKLYENSNLSEETKKTQSNELLKKNNELLTEKTKLTTK